jgi:hypothetical protein
MPRIRTIKPEFWQNEELAGLSEHARLLAISLLNHADDKGYFVASHQLVRAACFPFEEDSKNVLGSLQDLSRIGYIEVRNCDGKKIGRICKFLDHQRIDKPQKSKLHEIFEANPNENSYSKNVPGTFLEHSQNVPRLERKGKEEERERKGKDICTEADKQPTVPVDIPADDCRFPVFPCSGVEGQRNWTASERDIEVWTEAYPGVDCESQMRKAHAWVMSNPTRRKTRSGMPKFINGWLSKQQDASSGGKWNDEPKPKRRVIV